MAMNQVIPGITSPNKLTIPVGSRDHIQGLIDAPISLLEYGDYECPACGQAYRVVKAVQQSLGNSLCFAFRNFPLTTIHPHAEHAAEAAEAAAAQGNFWEMHDLLFENQNALEDEDLARNALILHLDIPLFITQLASGAFLGTRKGRCSERP
jgi:protein-disulfide isomerase